MVETRRSKILGPDGQPIQIPLLAGETAEPQRQGARAIVYYNEATGLTPARLADIMRSAAQGFMRSYLTLAIDMEERYLHYCAQLQTRRLALDSVTISVSSPQGVDARAVELAQSVVDDPMFPDLVASLQDGVGKGYSVVEPVWEYRSGALRPVLYQHRDPRFFRYDEIAQKDLCLLLDSGLPGEKIDAPYFIKHEPWLRAGLPGRRGLARPVAWAYVMQSFALQDWAAFCEIYGIPFRLGKYHPGATEAEKTTLLRAVRSIANDAAAIIPEGMTIEFQETISNRGEAVFGNLIAHVDGKVSLLVLGQTMTSEVSKSGGSLAQAQVQENVRMDIVRFDARSIAATLNRDLLRPMIAMNLGPQDIYPAIEMELAENEDLAALGRFLQSAVPMGLRVSQQFVRDRAGIPEPDPDEELLTAPAPAPIAANDPNAPQQEPPGGAKDQNKKPADPKAAQTQLSAQCPHCGGRHALLAADDPAQQTTDPLDALILAGASEWEPQLAPMVQAVLAAADESDSFEAFSKKLAELASQLDTDALASRLAIAQMKARGLGDTNGRD